MLGKFLPLLHWKGMEIRNGDLVRSIYLETCHLRFWNWFRFVSLLKLTFLFPFSNLFQIVSSDTVDGMLHAVNRVDLQL